MKSVVFIAALLLGTAASADTRATRSVYTLPQYVEKVGCVIVDKGGWTIVRAADGVSYCEGMKGYSVQSGRQYVADLDGDPETTDPGYVRDNN